MSKSILVLPDGTEISSGVGQRPAIQSAAYTQMVNSETELMCGSVCANMLETTLLDPDGSFSLSAGDEVAYITENEDGTRKQVGVFVLEKPTHPSAYTCRFTAYDRVTRLDKDLTEWMAALNEWPYSVFDFAHMVAEQCGLVLKNSSLLNGEYQIQKFSAQGITGRKIMGWIGQICAKFCRATADGELEFAWYENKYSITIAPSAYEQAGSGAAVSFADGNLSIDSLAVSSQDDGAGNVTISGLVVVSDDGDGNLVMAVDDGARTGLPYYMGSLSYEDYKTAPIEKVQLRLTEDDVGAVYPQVTGEVNTYTITGNYLLTTHDAEALARVARGVFDVLSHISYTPCKVSIPSNDKLNAGDIVRITDRSGRSFNAYVMTKSRKGQKDTLECTGSPRRDSTTVVNSETIKSLSGKLFEVNKSIDGLNAKAAATDTKVEQNIQQTREQFAEVDLKAAGLSVSVNNTLDKVKQDITKLQASADGVSIQVQSILDDGVSKVKTEMGYSFDDDGLKIQKPGGEMQNKLDDTGMEVSRSGEKVLKADKDGVIAVDVKVRNYLIVGEHARFENYNNGTDSARTACFWI